MIDTLDELSERAADLTSRVAEEKGELSLLALFHPEGALVDRWHLLVAAPWLETESMLPGLKYLSEELKRTRFDDLIKISRIVILQESYPIRQAIRRIAQTEGEPIVLFGGADRLV